MGFTKDNRAKPLWETVAYKGVPIFRALALALDHAEEDGARFNLLSADRRDPVLARFNKQYGTNLHGQQYLYDHQHEPGFFPANRPGTTSHCLCADGNPAYRVRGAVVQAGGKLPRYFLGIDAVDTGPGARSNDCSMLIGHLERLGYHVTRPYHSGSEAHHFSFVADPTPVLRHAGRIAAPLKPVALRNTAGVPAAAGNGKKNGKPKKATVLSVDGARFIARFEGFSAKLYNDAAVPPNATIGYGHVVHSGPIRGDEAPELRKGITKEQALELLRKDAAKAAAAVKSRVTVPLTQSQFDALVSFTFNCGVGAFESSTLLRKLNEGQYGAVPTELKKWVKAGSVTLPGLVTRRAAEGTLFSKGAYS